MKLVCGDIANDFHYGKLLGYYISDGVLSSKRTNYFGNTNVEFCSEVAQLLARFYKGHHISVRQTREQNYDTQTGVHRMKSFATYCTGGKSGGNPKVIAHQNKWREDYLSLGLDEKKSMKSLPKFGKDFKRGLIQGIFNGDGSLIRAVQGRDTQVSVSYNFGIAEEMAKEFIQILNEFGINAEHVMSSPSRYKTRYHEVKVVKYEDVCLMIQLLDDKKYPEKFDEAVQIPHEQFEHGYRKKDSLIGRYVRLVNPEMYQSLMINGIYTNV